MNVIVFYTCQVKRVKQRERVLEVDVVVGDAVHNKEALVAAKSSGVSNHGHVVATRVLLRRAHVALCVDAVVEAPVGHRGDSHTITEGATSVLLKRLEGGKTTNAELRADYNAVLAPKEASASRVDSDDEVAKSRGDVSLEVYCEPLGNGLRSRTRILLEKDRVLLLLVKVRRAAFNIVDHNAVAKIESTVFHYGKLMASGAFCEFSVVLDDMLIVMDA
ncbi:hypothetical protein HG531_002925 [Fusarium graminearum]|nr:hypothetical protein HG531_002925 [Fusarium graminearum]